MNKKFIIVIIISACLILLAIVSILLPKNNTNQQQPGQAQPNPVLNNSTPFSSSQNITGNVQNNYPTATKKETTQPDTNFETITNVTDKSQIQNAYNKFSSASPDSFKWTDFVGPNKKSINLNDFSKSVGLNIKPELNNLLDTSKFDLFSCPINNGSKNLGIALNFKLLPNYKGNLYKDELNIMRAWEATLFQDTRTIIFPDINFTSQQLSQKPTFQDGKNYRYAEISMPNNKKIYIDYSVIDDYVVITNSLDCLNKASDEIITPSN